MDALSQELMYYEVGMKHGLEGRVLEKFVADMHLKHRVPRCPEPPPVKRGEQALLPLDYPQE